MQIRRLTAQPVVARQYHYDMPFEMQADGPYFNLLDFFSRMSRLSRIINVGDLDFEDPDRARRREISVASGHVTVTGVFTATTFFTKPAESAALQRVRLHSQLERTNGNERTMRSVNTSYSGFCWRQALASLLAQGAPRAAPKRLLQRLSQRACGESHG